MKAKKKMGRPSKFDEGMIEQAGYLCRKGFTDDELAGFFKVTKQTVNNWKSAHPDFFDSIKDAKSEADAEVEKSLFERARGYSHEAVKIFCSKDGQVTEVPYTEHYPPDPTSLIFWLKNRQPDKWRDKQEHELSGTVNVTPIFEVTVKKGE